MQVSSSFRPQHSILAAGPNLENTPGHTGLLVRRGFKQGRQGKGELTPDEQFVFSKRVGRLHLGISVPPVDLYHTQRE